MAKGEFHIGPRGPGPCSADPSKPGAKGCPYGGASGSDGHFKTAVEAEVHYVRSMEEEHGMFSTTPATIPAYETRHAVIFGEDAEVLDHEMEVDEATEKANRLLITAGFRPMIVGGAVRDSLLGREAPKDFDIEIHGAKSFDQIFKVLKGKAQLTLTGKSFGVIKAKMKLDDGSWSEDLDLSLPRRESKIGDGHRGFKIEVDPTMSLHEATSRRDLTINSLLWDPVAKQVIDMHEGTKDLRNGILRHTSEAFDEDPLRVLRIARFSAKLGFSTADETVELSNSLVGNFDQLFSSRVTGELNRMILEPHAGKGFQFLKDSGWDKKMGDLSKVNTPELSKHMQAAQEDAAGMDQFNSKSGKRTMALSVMSKALLENGSKNSAKTLEHFVASGAELKRAVEISKSSILKIKGPISNSEARQLAWDNQKITAFEALTVAKTSSTDNSPERKAYTDAMAQFWELEILTKHEADKFDPEGVIARHKANNPGIKDGPWIRDILQEHRTAQYNRD